MLEPEVTLTAMIGATWREVPGVGPAPVVAVFASAKDVPTDRVPRATLRGADGRLYQVPVCWATSPDAKA